MNTNLLREKFLNFFTKYDHKCLKSSSIIPAQDPTLLFTNAGMNQFKELFLGLEERTYSSATTSQKCVRAGGKHNDLDEVGFTDRHLTFFEMLGNFSFGKYFKEEAIKFAWEFLTKELVIPVEKLSVTVHTSDQESFDLWNKKIGLSVDKIRILGDEDNFWQMGDVGPCGPCTEIFYDRGQDWEDKIIYGSSATRYLEIWNLVFMQFDQKENGTRSLLLKPGVDTGMGLERLAMIMQGGETIFDTDLFKPIFNFIEEKTGLIYKESNLEIQAAFNVVADHFRCATMIIADGGKPSNEGRGYVLRKIIRRGLLFLSKLTNDLNVISEISRIIAKIFLSSYPEVMIKISTINGILLMEKEKFANSLERGKKFFETLLLETKKNNSSSFDGDKVFKLYDTYGFPLEVSRVLARENGLEINIEDFNKKMEEQKTLSAAGTKSRALNFELPINLENQFVGYESIESNGKILWTEQKDNILFIATDKTPFFFECGGQVSDSGSLIVDKKIFEIQSVFKQVNGLNKTVSIIGINIEEKDLKLFEIGKIISQKVDAKTRSNTAKNHSGTHLLHEALRQVVGEHTVQSGSLVHPDYLRFAFTHDKPLTLDQINDVESLICKWVLENHETIQIYTNLEESQRLGATALFGEKYNPEKVRVIKIGDFSTELCGGTHVKNTGEIGFLKIISDESLGAGVRSIVALTGESALKNYQQSFDVIKNISQIFSCNTEAVLEQVNKKNQSLRDAEKEVLSLKFESLKNKITELEKNSILLKHGELIICEQPILSEEEQKYLFFQLLKINKKRIILILETNHPTILKFNCKLGSEALSKINLQELMSILKKNDSFKIGGKTDFFRGSCATEDKNILIEEIKNFC